MERNTHGKETTRGGDYMGKGLHGEVTTQKERHGGGNYTGRGLNGRGQHEGGNYTGRGLQREMGLNGERTRKRIKNRGHIHKGRIWTEKRHTPRRKY